MPGKPLLIAELLVIYCAAPLLLRRISNRFALLSALWLGTVYALVILRHAPGFNSRSLWNPQPLAQAIPGILALFAFAAAVIAFAVWKLHRQRLFAFPRSHPLLWTAILLLYPVLSVYPQGVVYRAFFFQRYQPLFPSPVALILASGVAFAFAHIIFRNKWSLVLTFAAGILFAWRYESTNSLFVSCFEHTLYGCYMFTVGLGGLFFRGLDRLPLRR